MKKIISLIASVAMLATMVSSVFAASIENNAPVVENTVAEVSAEEYQGLMGSSLEAGQKAYMITVNASGFDLESKPGTGFGGNAKRTGLLLSTVDYKMVFEDPSKLVMAAATNDGLVSAKADEVYVTAAYTTTASMYPVIANTEAAGKTVTTNDKIYLNTFLIVVSGEVEANLVGEFTVVPVTNDVAGASKVFRNDNNNISYTVNGEAATTVTFGASAQEPDPEPLEDFVIENKRDLDSGWSWDVTINNFESAATYKATFTAGSETKTNELFFDGAEVAEGGSIAFAALLKTTKAAVELALSK